MYVFVIFSEMLFVGLIMDDIGFLSKFIAVAYIYIFGPNGSLHFTILLKEERKRER